MPNPFFSARIPQDLFEKIEQLITETGESKTQILIKALAAYVNHPVEMQVSSASRSVSLEMFAALEERVASLEQFFQTPKELVINTDNIRNQTKSEHPVVDTVISADNNLDVFPDPWSDTSVTTSQITPDNTDNNQLTDVIQTVLLLAPPPSGSTNQTDNTDNTTRGAEPQQVQLFDTPRENIGPYNESKMAEELGINRNKLRRHLNRIEAGEIRSDTPVEVVRAGQLYRVTYLGKPQGRKLWTATPIESGF
jgi:hypothetical protein